MLCIIIAIIAAIIGGIFVFIHSPAFGGKMDGERLERALRSDNYRDGRFYNIGDVGVAEKMDIGSLARMARRHLKHNGGEADISRNAFGTVAHEGDIPVKRSDSDSLDRNQDIIIWFGHSSYMLQVDGVRFLIDPVFYIASPVWFVNRPFPGVNIFSPDDIPEVDYLVITHDHWDHLDYRTVKELSPKVGKVICPLGVGAHFERWGYGAERLIELDWNETADLTGGSTVECLPSQHFSGRGLDRNPTLWASYMLRLTSGNIFISGDGGYGQHFKAIAERYPSIYLAILENGQYNELWRPIHIMPDALPVIIKELSPENVITVHHSKYALAKHPWNEPRLTEDKLFESDSLGGRSFINGNSKLIRLKIGEITQLKL